MKTKRLISLLLAAVFALSAAATPALAASTGSELPDRTAAGVDETNSVVSIRLTADGDLTYGSPFTLSVQTTPADTQYIGVVMGTSGEAQGYVTLILLLLEFHHVQATASKYLPHLLHLLQHLRP